MRYHPKPYKMIKVSDAIRYPQRTSDTIQYVGWGDDVQKSLRAYARKIKYKEPKVYNPALNNKDVYDERQPFSNKHIHPYRLGCSCPSCEHLWYQMKLRA